MNKREIDAALYRVSLGDNEAFGRLYEETRRGVYAFLFSYFNNSCDCEDAVQTTYLKIKTNISHYQKGTNGLAWILQIAKNVALSELRKKKTDEKRLDNYIESEETVSEPQYKGEIIDLMKRTLDEDEQRIVILHAVWDYKHKEIAEMLNCPTGTVTSKYKRAVDKMKKAWKEGNR